MRTGKKKYFMPFVSPWMIIGVSCLLIAVVVFQAAVNYNREKKYMGKLLKEKGAALILSFEAGAKTGMMGMMGGMANIQTLLETTASQPDISYIFIVDRNGTILACNNRKIIGTRIYDYDLKKLAGNADLTQPRWRIVNKNNISYFEVYKIFLPFLNNPARCFNTCAVNSTGKRICMHMRYSAGWMRGLGADRIFDPKNRPVIFIGMDIKPFKAAMTQDMHNSLIMMAVILFLGLTGVVSLFWAQGYTRSRKLLQDTKALASEIIKNLPLGIIVVNKGSGISYINEIACSFLNVDPFDAEKNSENAEDVIPVEIWQLRENINAENFVAEKEIFFRTKGGKNVPVSVSITDMIAEQGGFMGLIFILKDLSDIKALEVKIQRKERLAALGTLAAGIAHEVRNPLSSIKGYATFFASLFEEKSENRRAAYVMAQEVDRVDRVISELLEFARPAQLKLRKTDVAKLINDSLGIIRHEAASANVKIETKIDQFLFSPELDSDRFMQVLLNLYINAIHAMKNGGGVLRVTAGITAMPGMAGKRENTETAGYKPKNIKTWAGRSGHAEQETLVIEISDTGSGISLNDQTRIFNPYFTTKCRGTGIGLAIVYKIIESHNGTIHVNSVEGKGATFTIFIPVTNGKEA